MTEKEARINYLLLVLFDILSIALYFGQYGERFSTSNDIP